MAAYSERAGREEERDIKERSHCGEGGRQVTKIHCNLYHCTRESSAILSKCITSKHHLSEPSLLAFCIRLNNPRVRIQHSFLFSPVPHCLQAPVFFPLQSQNCIDWQQTLISGTESEAETMGGAGEAVVSVRSFVFNAVVWL